MMRIYQEVFRRSFGLLLLTAALSACGGGHDNVEHFLATLQGGNEVPPNASIYVASVGFDIVKGERIDYYAPFLPFVGNDIVGAHVHVGDPGQNGPIILVLHQDSTPEMLASYSGSWTAADLVPNPASGITTFADAVQAIRDGHAYVNLRTAEYPEGEIRGQIVPGKLGPFGEEEAPDEPTPPTPSPPSPTPLDF